MQAVGGEYIRLVACDAFGREIFVCGAACGLPCIVVGDDQSLFIGKCLREDVRQAVENTDDALPERCSPAKPFLVLAPSGSAVLVDRRPKYLAVSC